MLATSTLARRLQGCDARLSLAVWHFAIVPIADDCRLVANARERRLRSTGSRTCAVTRTYSTFGDKAFAALLDPYYGTVFHRTQKRRTYSTIDFGGR